MKKRFTDEQVIGFLREAESGVAIKDLCRRHGFDLPPPAIPVITDKARG
ncbi:transposase [Xanthomonas campestris pv. campestris]|nr:transposase [Xanthomonas campestris]